LDSFSSLLNAVFEFPFYFWRIIYFYRCTILVLFFVPSLLLLLWSLFFHSIGLYFYFLFFLSIGLFFLSFSFFLFQKLKPLGGTWWTARIAIARKICSTRFYYCSTPFEQ
jgi:hypothetical protein